MFSFPSFPLKIPSSVTPGILPVSLWNCSPIEPLKSDYRAKTSEIPSIFPVIWEFDRMRPVRSGMHPPPFDTSAAAEQPTFRKLGPASHIGIPDSARLRLLSLGLQVV